MSDVKGMCWKRRRFWQTQVIITTAQDSVVLTHSYLSWINSRSEFDNGGITTSRLEWKGKEKREEKEMVIFAEIPFCACWAVRYWLDTCKLFPVVQSIAPWCKCYPCFTVQEIHGCSASDSISQGEGSNSWLFNPRPHALNHNHLSISWRLQKFHFLSLNTKCFILFHPENTLLPAHF